MKFLAVFVALAAVAFGYPTTSIWTLEELTAALQDPNTNPNHIPYLEEALDHYMAALYAGIDKPTITVMIPAESEPEHIDVWPIDVPAEESDHIDVWPIELPAEEADHIDVWPIELPAEEPEHVSPGATAPSSPLVQIIVNVQKQQEQQIPVVVDEEHKPEDSDFIDVFPIQIPAEDAEHIDVWPIQIPAEDTDHIDVWPVQIPGEESDHMDVWPVQIPGEVPDHIDVWPIAIPEEEAVSPVAPTPSAPSSPLVQIIVNVQKQQEIAASPVAVVEDPMAR